MKIALVIHRFGVEVVGGAETLAREVALRLAALPGVSVEVLTTAARDYTTWANFYPEGESVDQGVRIRRFANRAGRSRFFGLYNRFVPRVILGLQKRRAVRFLAIPLEALWFFLQGPYCPKLIRYIESHAGDYDKFIFSTYLYHPTVRGLPKVWSKSILVPNAHDEPPFHFGKIKELLRLSGPMLVNSYPEKQLILTKIPERDSEIKIAGLGIDLPVKPQTKVEPSIPYVLYLGRICEGKGVPKLIAWFDEFRKVHGPCRLLLAGHRENGVVLPEADWIEYAGFVDEQAKLELIIGARCVVNPSAYESLSIIVLEAMAYDTPVLVNNLSPVLRYYADHTTTVFGFDGPKEFFEQLTLIFATDWKSDACQTELAASRRWVMQNYSWAAIVQQYQAALSEPF